MFSIKTYTLGMTYNANKGVRSWAGVSIYSRNVLYKTGLPSVSGMAAISVQESNRVHGHAKGHQ